jgi:hypothetical protein
LNEWLPRQPHMQVLRVRYHELVQDPEGQARRVHEFLDAKPDVGKMAKSVDSSLYRNRKT